MEEKVMEGYVRNKTNIWRHAMKRAVAPNGKIELDDIYKQYSVKHDIEEGQPFVEWLRQIKLKNSDIWEIVYKEDSSGKLEEEKKVEKVEEKKKPDAQPPFVKKNKTVDEIVGMTVREARTELEKVNDIKLLKYALSSARQLANKDTLCNLLRKRIQILELRR
jgi:hypothetical protein